MIVDAKSDTETLEPLKSERNFNTAAESKLQEVCYD